MNLENIVKQFKFKGQFIEGSSYGEGHINDTYLIVFQDGNDKNYYILQRLNSNIFKNIASLMNNVKLVTDFVRKKVIEAGGDPNRECMRIIDTVDNKTYFDDGDNNYWRAYDFIQNTISYQVVDSEDVFRDTGKAFGVFIANLDEFDASQLYEVIPNFHNTRDRYNTFEKALKADTVKRADTAKDEIDFVLARNKYCDIIVDGLQSGEIPLRVTHNDTKANNVLVDADTKKAICIIDLDTIMPGSLLYDFGDAIRSGCNTGLEDEKDLSKVEFNERLYEVFCEGFLKGIGEKITDKEVELLPLGAIMMTYECGIRFLTDYLDGDHYFKTHYAEHNLVRARTQFKLVAEMEKRYDKLLSIAKSYAAK